MKHIKIFESFTKDQLKAYLKDKIAWAIPNHAEYLATQYIDENYTFAYSIWVSDTGSIVDYNDFFCLYNENGEFSDDMDVLTIGKMYGDEHGFIYCISIGSASGYDKQDCDQVLRRIVDRMKSKYSLDVQDITSTEDLINGFSVFIKAVS